jgi:hypothetical protein
MFDFEDLPKPLETTSSLDYYLRKKINDGNFLQKKDNKVFFETGTYIKY